MAPRRGVAAAERIVADARLPASLRAQDLELGLRVARRRADVRKCLHEADADHERGDGQSDRQPASLRRGQDEEPEGEGEVRGTRVCPQQSGIGDRGRCDRPPVGTTSDEVEQHDDEHVRRRQWAEERRDEPPDRILLVARVEHPVLRQTRQAPIAETELVPKPPGHARVAPPLQRDGVDVDQAPQREQDRGAGKREGDAPPRRRGEHEQAAEEIGGNGQQVVPGRKQLPSRCRAAVEPRLRQEPVEEHEARKRECQPIGPQRGGE